MIRPLSWSAAMSATSMRSVAATPVSGLCAATACAASVGQPEAAQRLGGHGAVARDVVLGLLGVEVVAQAGEAPDVRVLAEAHGQRAHDRLGGEHVAAQVLVGDARLAPRRARGARSSVIARSPASIWSAMAAAQAVLLVRGTWTSPSGVEDGDLVLVGADADALGEDVVEHEQVDALGGLLGARPVEPRAGLGGEADAEQARARGGREHVDRAHELERERLALAALDLAALLVPGPEVGDGRGHDEHVGVAHLLGRPPRPCRRRSRRGTTS